MKTVEGHSAASSDVEELKAEKAPHASMGSDNALFVLLPIVPAAAPAVKEEWDLATANLLGIAPLKGFYHPAHVEPQRVVWAPPSCVIDCYIQDTQASVYS